MFLHCLSWASVTHCITILLVWLSFARIHNLTVCSVKITLNINSRDERKWCDNSTLMKNDASYFLPYNKSYTIRIVSIRLKHFKFSKSAICCYELSYMYFKFLYYDPSPQYLNKRLITFGGTVSKEAIMWKAVWRHCVDMPAFTKPRCAGDIAFVSLSLTELSWLHFHCLSHKWYFIMTSVSN